ncbi:hypothetical protein ARHIZOSPH14_04200 [Agromyces rhizosphaerae]|uniref:Helicase n=1 Tax=Agromyces rhizosphaerae TaxID=88374 RepID=A0A9W6FQK9_9MICO|nr:Rv3654c family TadE-like protein [Agromyces rhizosphaerae]GLI26178.1 hypothetical protein ARHIZOSPH14_04200 [Agromyces rhizosphaerae]
MGARAGGISAERGAGSVLALGVVAATVALTAPVLAASAMLLGGQLAANAADAAALAAADAVSGAVPGEPCERAADAAARNGGTLEACAIDGLVAEVRARVVVAGLAQAARARAGPPGAGLEP